MTKRYVLEIYLPGNSGYDAACVIESDLPFLQIQKGDFINPRTWPSGYSANLHAYIDNNKYPYGIVLRVTAIEHFIILKQDGFTQHKLGIFTEAVDDVAESRVEGERL
jgi:hypothetical protein